MYRQSFATRMQVQSCHTQTVQSAVLQHTYRRWRRLADQSHLFSLPSESNRIRLFLDVYKIVQAYNTPEIGDPDSNWWDVGSTAFLIPIFAYLHRSSSCLEFSLELLLTSFAQDGHRTLQLSILPGFQNYLGEALPSLMNCFRFAFQVPSILVPSYLIATELILAIRVCKWQMCPKHIAKQ